jgi:hypothetical protein
MAGRRTFFSFHFQKDIWRANVVRNAQAVDAVARWPFADASLWEESAKKSDEAIHKMIDTALIGTSVTVVLIGSETASRKFVKYEITQSKARGNGLLGVRIHNIENQHGLGSIAGPVPAGVNTVIPWNRSTFGASVEKAALAAGKNCLAHARNPCYLCG